MPPSLPTLTPPPPAPSRADDSDLFVSKADAHVAWQETNVAEMNAVVEAIPEIAAAINYNTSSTTSLAIGTGSKSFTIPDGGLLQVGQFVIAASESAPSNYMAGQVTSHDSETGALTVNVSSTGGSGTFSDWIIAVTVADALVPVAQIAISGSGADLVDASVPYAKLQNVSAASKLLGRGAGSGAGIVQEISLGTNLSMTGNTLNVSSGTATLGDGDYGDIVASTSGTVLTLDNNVVSFAKMADLATNTLLGRASAGTGDPEAITCTAAGRALLDDADAAAQRVTLGLGNKNVAEEWALNFAANGDAYIPAAVAMTIDQGNAAIGTGTLAYAKSTSAAPGTFTTTTLPATIEAGAWLRVSATGVAGFKATHLKRTA